MSTRQELTPRQTALLARQYNRLDDPLARQYTRLILLDQLKAWGRRDSRYCSAFLLLLYRGNTTLQLEPNRELHEWLSYRFAEWVCKHLADMDRGYK